MVQTVAAGTGVVWQQATVLAPWMTRLTSSRAGGDPKAHLPCMGHGCMHVLHRAWQVSECSSDPHVQYHRWGVLPGFLVCSLRACARPHAGVAGASSAAGGSRSGSSSSTQAAAATGERWCAMT